MSVGVAANKFVAKVASDLRKPDALVVVPPGTERAFLAPLPVGRLWGVGARTAELLARAGMRTIADVQTRAPDDLCRANTAIMTSDLADAYYGGWVQTQNADSLDYAEQLYAQHVALFADAAQVRARYAEVLWARADHEPNATLRSGRWTRAASVFATLQTYLAGTYVNNINLLGHTFQVIAQGDAGYRQDEEWVGQLKTRSASRSRTRSISAMACPSMERAAPPQLPPWRKRRSDSSMNSTAREGLPRLRTAKAAEVNAEATMST